MALTQLDILQRGLYENGRGFGDVGPYERIEAVAHYVVDPLHAANQSVVDLSLAAREADGLVHFQGDVTLLQPVQTGAGNRALLMQVPNRGKRVLARFNQSPMGTEDTAEIAPGDGFLFAQGWTIAWAGWQWDVPRTAERPRIGLVPPGVPVAARRPPGQMQLRIQPDQARDCLPLTDQHVGDLGRHSLVRVGDIDEPGAKLWVRHGPYGEPELMPRTQWRFARVNDGSVVGDDGHVWLDGGFEAGRIYDLLYTPMDCPVVGAGLLATRELASYLRYDAAAPTAGAIDHVIGEGQSQCGRFLRTYLYLGLNRDEAGRPALDGVLAHIAGGRRGEFNHRYAQPSVQPTPSFGHLFPFADGRQIDPLTGTTDGLLLRQTAAGAMPKIIYTDTSSEYWRGDAGLSHGNLETGGDAELPSGVRRYLFASTQHGPGAAVLVKRTMFGSHGQNYLNIIDYRPLYRAALMNLLAWVKEDTAPPESAFPTAANNNRGTRSEVMDRLSTIPGLALPDAAVMTWVYPLDLGPDAERGIGAMPAKIGPVAYPDWVSKVDENGNEAAGLAMPDVAVPVATHTGFNPRHPDTGGAGQLLEYVGSTIPFARDKASREAAGDPRPSLPERYPSRAVYLERVRAVAADLVGQRYLLAQDVALCVDLAAARYDACMGQ
ncbi:MAG: alpha/beta hydrolase domain-containing protein [Proteobacteria bacterium]|nr:alpha/beta hydrolase domain-containing protein [Pseudomonadota bacterium]